MRATALVMAMIGGLLVAGCSTTLSGSAAPAGPREPGTPSAAGQASQDASAGPDDNYGAPRVTTPLATAKWLPDPCATLTPAQLQGLGITGKGNLQVSDQGNICQWSLDYNVVYAFAFNVKFTPGEPPGLANAYVEAGPGGMRRLPDVHGQPAATEPSQNTDGNCTIYLGATDQIEYAATVSIGAGRPHYADPCPVAEQIADDATATMKSGV